MQEYIFRFIEGVRKQNAKGCIGHMKEEVTSSKVLANEK
jgi:hypothetical protein